MTEPTTSSSYVFVNRALFALAGLAALSFLVAVAFASARSPFLDESAYIQNLFLPLGSFFEMLPYYDAARPPAVSLYLSPIWDAFTSVLALRIAVLVVFLVSAGFFLISIYRYQGSRNAFFALIFMCALPEVVRYSTEVKHFGIEMAAAMLLLSVLIPRFHSVLSGKAIAMLSAMVLGLSFVSLSIIFIVLAVSAERVLFSKSMSVSVSWMGLALGSLLLWAPCYLWVHKPILVAQLSNYPDVYDAFSLANAWYVSDFWNHAHRQVVLLFGGMALLGFWLLMIGLAVLLHLRCLLTTKFAPLRMVLALLFGVLLASALDQYPITSSRQFIFIVPLLALAFAACADALVQRTHVYVALVVAMPVVLLATQNGKDAVAGEFDHQPLLALMEEVEAHPSDAVLMFNAIQPGWELLENVHQKRFAEEVYAWVPPGTGVRPEWAVVEQDFEAVVSSPIAWSALSHLRDKRRFDLYTDWLIDQAPKGRVVLLPLAQMFPDRTKALKASLGRRGCEYSNIYRNKGVQLYEIACPELDPSEL